LPVQLFDAVSGDAFSKASAEAPGRLLAGVPRVRGNTRTPNDGGNTEMKRQKIEVVIGFLDAIRRGDREAAGRFLHPEIFWQGVAPHLACRNDAEVLGIFLRRRGPDGIEIERLDVIGANRGAVFAIHRAEPWEVEGIQIPGVMYHAAQIDEGRITRIADYPNLADAMAEVD
jgi:hypothetical protein